MLHRALFRTFWGTGYGECTTCLETNDPAWTCPAAAATYRDMGGSDNNIVELDGSGGKQKRSSVCTQGRRIDWMVLVAFGELCQRFFMLKE